MTTKAQRIAIGTGTPQVALNGTIQRRFSQLATRHRFLMGTLIGLLLAILTMWQVLNAFNYAYNLFDNIVSNSSVKVDAAEKSIQYIANVNKYAADYISNFDNFAKRSEAYINLQLDFAKFRDQMFTLREGLQDFHDTRAFLVAEQKIFEKYWGSVSNLLVARRQGDINTAVTSYANVDDLLENSITPALQQIESFNFEAMVTDKSQSTSIIYSQLFILAVGGIGLAVLLTFLSFWLRKKIKRYLTPGIDIAAVLAWICAIIMLIQLASLPNELKIMVQDAYYSISGVSRVVAVANQANRTESAVLNDPTNAKNWQAKFDTYSNKLQLLMCGQPGCMQTPFSIVPNGDSGNSTVIQSALNISLDNSKLIDNVQPLIANTTFPGEVRALEKARTAYLQYLQYDGQMRTLLQQNNLTAVSNINTGVSDQAFAKFTQAMQDEHDINQQVFESVWERQKSALWLYPLEFGVVGYGLVILLVVGGMWHRYREL